MFNYAFAISFTIICLLFPFSNANSSVDSDETGFIVFVKDPQQTETNVDAIEKYEAYLGLLYFLKKNWQCDKKGEKFGKICQKYRKYLGILYEYLYREFIGLPVIRPKFVLKERQKVMKSSIIKVLNYLARISCFYFDPNLRSEKNLIIAKPKLVNKQRLNYRAQKIEQLVSITEAILQLAIYASYGPPNESVDGLMRQIFEQNLDGMLRKATDSAQKEVDSSSSSSDLNTIMRLLGFIELEEMKKIKMRKYSKWKYKIKRKQEQGKIYTVGVETIHKILEDLKIKMPTLRRWISKKYKH